MTSNLDKNIGYKQIRGNKIVELEILGNHNENRSTIVIPFYAKMRCSKARVLDIYSIDDFSVKFNSGVSLYDENFIYEVGSIISTSYDQNDNIICGKGIHYYLNVESAIGNELLYFKKYTGIAIKANDGGEAVRRYYFVEGKSVLESEYYYLRYILLALIGIYLYMLF